MDDETTGGGRIEAIFLAVGPRGAGPRTRVEGVRAVEGKGLEGDRFFGRVDGPRAKWRGERQVTLIEAEAVEAMRALGRDFAPGDSKRNLVTRGVPLTDLVGREFRVGEAVLRGVELCDPCTHLGRTTWRGIERDLADRGGLRAAVLRGGEIREGDAVAWE